MVDHRKHCSFSYKVFQVPQLISRYGPVQLLKFIFVDITRAMKYLEQKAKRLTSSPKGVDSTNQRQLMSVYTMFIPQKMLNLYKCSIFVIKETQFAI